MRRFLATAAVVAALVVALGPAVTAQAAGPGPKGGSGKGGAAKGLLQALKGVPPILGKNGVDNR
ncbi:hypothetical protein [Streptomyces axinellae]|uniref:Uncharacterized protein n=1 Tax=Streptomyces axinellae TaxID=552788 RepID=A0ABN3PNW6_9ACTN